MRFPSIVLLVVLLGILLTATGLQTYAQYHSGEPAPTQDPTITLTANGFEPAELTVALGTRIIWQNTTSQTYTLKGEFAYRIFLPLLKNPTTGSHVRSSSTVAATSAFNGTLVAGGTFSQQMTASGEIVYSLAELPQFSGRLIIRSHVTPTATTSATVIPTTTLTRTPTGTVLPATSTPPTATPTHTPTDGPTATPTHTPTDGPTATPTHTPTDGPTTTPTHTPTDGPTTTPTHTPTHVPTSTPTSTPTTTPTTTPTAPSLLSVWMLNTTGETSAYIRSSGSPILVNVESAQQVTMGGGSTSVQVLASGIPNYTYTLTDADIQTLNSRPQASSDFVNGATSASAGQTIAFGQDIGYRSTSAGTACPSGQGYGYWPPGPSCPTDANHSRMFPMTPQVATTPTAVSPTSGLWVNGTAIFDWSDNMSYNGQGVWDNLAMKLEFYDMDICTGHAPPGGTYHHHGYPNCLAQQLGDDGTAHSPVYGVAFDGYMLYGPWYANGVLAQGGWKTRDYSASSATGCGADNKRTCLLVDEYDITKGTVAASSAGPDTNATVTSASGNQFVATSGFYYQDYYYDSSCSGTHCLDENSGHSHDNLGYHYHIPMIQNQDGSLTNVFPFTFGPRYRGQIRQRPALTSLLWPRLPSSYMKGSLSAQQSRRGGP